MTDVTRRGKSLTPPPSGWPDRPAGTPTDLDRIAAWLVPGTIDPLRSSAVRTKADARAWVLTIVADLLAALRSSAKSPRLRDTREKLDRIARLALDLDRTLAGLSGPQGLTRIVALECGFFRQKSGAKGITHEFVDWDSILTTPLRTLAESALAYKQEMARSASKGSGRQRLHERLFDDPRTPFARSSASLLRECRNGREGAAPADREVLELMHMIWEFATGDPAAIGLLDHAATVGTAEIRRGNPSSGGTVIMKGLIVPKIDD